MSFDLNKDKDYKSVINKLEEQNKNHKKNKRKQNRLFFLMFSLGLILIISIYLNLDFLTDDIDLMVSNDDTKEIVDDIEAKSIDKQTSKSETSPEDINSKASIKSFHDGLKTSYRIDGPANFRTDANVSGDVVFSINDNVGLDFIKNQTNNWFQCGFYLSNKTNINWLEKYSKRTGNQLGEIYSETNLYNSYDELIGKSKSKFYVSKDQLTSDIIIYAYTAKQNLRYINNHNKAKSENPNNEYDSKNIQKERFSTISVSTYLYFRKEPIVAEYTKFPNGSKFRHLHDGDRVEIIQKTNKCETINEEFGCWYEVKYLGTRGYVFGAFLK